MIQKVTSFPENYSMFLTVDIPEEKRKTQISPLVDINFITIYTIYGYLSIYFSKHQYFASLTLPGSDTVKPELTPWICILC